MLHVRHHSFRILGPFLALTSLMHAQSAPADGNAPNIDHHKLIELTGYEVTGTRLPVESVIRLSGLRVGQKVNYDILTEACNKITSTGLVSTVNYAYNVDPGKPGVKVSFKIWDELPLLPSKIDPPEQADQIWGCLESADPVFTRELPNTKDALRFYSTNMEKCLEEAGRQGQHVATTVACDLKGHATEIVFKVGDQQAAASDK